jgi:hypothetical protein
MLQKRMLMGLGFGAMLAISTVSWSIAGVLPQTQVQQHTGQISAITIDRCDQLGTCEGSIVLEQRRGPEVALAIRPGTRIQRGDQLVHLEELGIGNYVTVQAAPLSGEAGEPERDGNIEVGTSMGERPLTLQEANEY